MEIKEPAAIFSEAGLKIFIEAIKEYTQGDHSNQSSDNEVDKLIHEYKDYKEKQDQPDKMDVITEHLTKYMDDGKSKNTKEIMTYVNNVLGFDYSLRSITAMMRGVTNRNPNFIKLNARQYKLNTVEVGDNE